MAVAKTDMSLTRPYEFWNPRLFEAPYYLYLAWQCLRLGLPPRFLAKANWALDHGEIGIGSKYQTQLAFDQSRFPMTTRIPGNATRTEKRRIGAEFVRRSGLPVVLKPDQGNVGKGVTRADTEQILNEKIDRTIGPYLLQKYTANNFEYGVFFVRQKGVNRITGINRKHFPTVTGDGVSSIAELAIAHPRFTPHWQLFLADQDTRRVPANGEEVQLSFIGSHTMGCRFTDDTHLVSRDLERNIFAFCDSQPGFNFGRLDVKAADENAFRRGEFIVIEVNGVASLPTNMFDPAYRLKDAYRIFFQHGRLLAEIAHEHRDHAMNIASLSEVLTRVAASQRQLDAAHDQFRSS